MYYYVVHLLPAHSLFTYHFYWHKYYFPSPLYYIYITFLYLSTISKYSQ